MRKKFNVRNISLGSLFLLVVTVALYAFFDQYKENRFRTMQDQVDTTERVDLTGLYELQASGGSAPLFKNLQEKLNHVKKRKILLDVRKSACGYVKGIPIKFFGYQLKKPGLRHLPRRLLYTGTIDNHPEYHTSEKEEAEKYGFEYVAISIGSKYVTPDKNIDSFINFIDTLSDDAWVHFHCDQGMGRTSLALVMFDIMKNAPQVSLADIIKRQYLLGSIDIEDTSVWAKASYSQKMLKDRLNAIKEFYDFIVQRKAGGIQQWSEWKKSKNTTAPT